VCILIHNVTVKVVPGQVGTKFELLELVAVDIVPTASSFRLFVVYIGHLLVQLRFTFFQNNLV